MVEVIKRNVMKWNGNQNASTNGKKLMKKNVIDFVGVEMVVHDFDFDLVSDHPDVLYPVITSDLLIPFAIVHGVHVHVQHAVEMTLVAAGKASRTIDEPGNEVALFVEIFPGIFFWQVVVVAVNESKIMSASASAMARKNVV